MIELKNGLVIVNLTPHVLYFLEDGQTLTCPSDGVANVKAVDYEVENTDERYQLVELRWVPRRDGLKTVKEIRRLYPKAIIVGTVLAAQAFPGEVFAPVSTRSDYQRNASERTYRTDRFTTFTKGEHQHG